MRIFAGHWASQKHFDCDVTAERSKLNTLFFSLACAIFRTNSDAQNISFSVNILWRWQHWRNKKKTNDRTESFISAPKGRRAVGWAPTQSRRGTEWVIADNSFDDILRTCCFPKNDAHHSLSTAARVRTQQQSFLRLGNIYAGWLPSVDGSYAEADTHMYSNEWNQRSERRLLLSTSIREIPSCFFPSPVAGYFRPTQTYLNSFNLCACTK